MKTKKMCQHCDGVKTFGVKAHDSWCPTLKPVPAPTEPHTPTSLRQENFKLIDANGGEWNLIPHYPDERGEAENKYAAEILLPLIVRAVNAYEAKETKIAVLRRLLEKATGWSCDEISQAIAKAEGSK